MQEILAKDACRCEAASKERRVDGKKGPPPVLVRFSAHEIRKFGEVLLNGVFYNTRAQLTTQSLPTAFLLILINYLARLLDLLARLRDL